MESGRHGNVSLNTNFEFKTFVEVVRLLKKGPSWPAQMARQLEIKRQSMHEVWNSMIVPLAAYGVFVIRQPAPCWGCSKYLVALAPDWEERFIEFVRRCVEG